VKVPGYGRSREVLATVQMVMLKPLKCPIRVIWFFSQDPPGMFRGFFAGLAVTARSAAKFFRHHRAAHGTVILGPLKSKKRLLDSTRSKTQFYSENLVGLAAAQFER
jgi:hypothetical protein